MKHCLLTMCFVALAVSAGLAQQKPPAKHADAGPSLPDTTKFIQHKLKEQGRINFAVYTHDNQSREDAAFQLGLETTDFVIDSEKCLLRYVQKRFVGSSPEEWTRSNLPANSIKTLKVMSADSWWSQEMADEGTPMKTVQVQPASFILSLGRAEKGVSCSTTTNDGKTNTIECPEPELYERLAKTWSFRDEDTANRVAKAVVHAVELCDGGSTSEPF
jgi:hypothetical protein